MYHPCFPWYSQLSRWFGFACMTTFVPGGERETLFKSWFPCREAHDERRGFIRDDQSRLSVSSHWGSNLSHSWIGKAGSQDARPAKKWFLNVRMAHSSAFRRCWWGGTSLYCCLFFNIPNLKSPEHSLSKIYNLGVIPLFAILWSLWVNAL